MGKTDFQKVVVRKPWGYEYLVFENDSVAVWFLRIKGGNATSLHCHPKKKTGLIVLSGEAQVSFMQSSHSLKALDKLVLRPGLFHSTSAISKDGIIMLELETPVDKENLVRFEDRYGREGKAYEEGDQMEPLPPEFIRFNVPGEGVSEYVVQDIVLTVEKIKDFSVLKKRPPEEVIAVLDGSLKTKEGEVIVGPGDVGSLGSLARVAAVFSAPEGLTMMTVRRKKDAEENSPKQGTVKSKPKSIRDRGPFLGAIPGLSQNFSKEKSLDLFKQICINRYFELETAKAFNAGIIKMPIYLSVGQEHISAAIAAASKKFMIFAQHRAHSYYLSFGGNPRKLVDELLHRETGCAQGMGGSASIHDPLIGMFGHSGLMGDQVPLAVGAALGSGKPVLTVTGDASVEEDYVFGAMGYAVTKKLPVLFVCEDNNLSILTEVQTRRSWNMTDVARSLGMLAMDITDDPWLIAHSTDQVFDSLPAFLNIRTCRHLWHAGTGKDGDPEWNRFEMIKQELNHLGFKKEAEIVEKEAILSMERLWQEQLQKPSNK